MKLVDKTTDVWKNTLYTYKEGSREFILNLQRYVSRPKGERESSYYCAYVIDKERKRTFSIDVFARMSKKKATQRGEDFLKGYISALDIKDKEV